MKPTLHIELDELIEYRDEMDETIKYFEQLNNEWEDKINKLHDEGYDFEEIYNILSILYKDTEVNDDE